MVSTWPRPLATLMLPAATGGANWQGGALDPETKIFYIFTNNAVTALGLIPPPAERSDMAYIQGPRAIRTLRRLRGRPAAVAAVAAKAAEA